MTATEEMLADIRKAVAKFTSHEALLTVAIAPDEEEPSVEVHLLDVAAAEAFSAMEALVEELSDKVGEHRFLVFAHDPFASVSIRRRLAGRSKTVRPAANSAIQWTAAKLPTVKWLQLSSATRFLERLDISAISMGDFKSTIDWGNIEVRYIWESLPSYAPARDDFALWLEGLETWRARRPTQHEEGQLPPCTPSVAA